MDNCCTTDLPKSSCSDGIRSICVKKPSDAGPLLLWIKTTCVNGLAELSYWWDQEATVPSEYTLADETKCPPDKRGMSCDYPVHVKVCDKKPGEITQEASWAHGDDLSTLGEGTSFSVTKSACCSVLLETSVGPLFLPMSVVNYSTQIYKVPITIDSVTIVEGTCDLHEVIINANLSY